MSLIFQPVLIRSSAGRPPPERSTQIILKRASEHTQTKTQGQGGKCEDARSFAAAASKLKELEAQSAAAAEAHVWCSGGEHVSTRRTRARSKIPGEPHAQDAVGCRRRGNRSQAPRERKWRRQQGVGGSEEESRTSCCSSSLLSNVRHQFRKKEKL